MSSSLNPCPVARSNHYHPTHCNTERRGKNPNCKSLPGQNGGGNLSSNTVFYMKNNESVLLSDSNTAHMVRCTLVFQAFLDGLHSTSLASIFSLILFVLC